MLARIIFFAAAASAAIGAAALAGVIIAVIGLSIGMTTASIMTWMAGAATAAFGTIIAVASFAAILFFSDSCQLPGSADSPSLPPADDQVASRAGTSASSIGDRSAS